MVSEKVLFLLITDQKTAFFTFLMVRSWFVHLPLKIRCLWNRNMRGIFCDFDEKLGYD